MRNALFTLALGLLLGCSASGGEDTAGLGGAGGGSTGGTGASAGGTSGAGGSAASGAVGGSAGTINVPDSGGGAGGSSPQDCGSTLPARIRDFTEQHSDFEHFLGGVQKGLVLPDLGPDQKPVYAAAGATQNTSGPAQFLHWYNDTPNFNFPLQTTIQFTDTGAGFLYDNPSFFPIDGQGFGNGPNDIFQPSQHNYLFTTEIHTKFTYKGGETFTFRGDDDLWIFVNNKLAIDIGGVHGPSEESISMDALAGQLGITVGQTYPMDIFHAERHTSESNFRIQTTIECFTPIEPT
jgi:fibro-slime domain-containing protein